MRARLAQAAQPLLGWTLREVGNQGNGSRGVGYLSKTARNSPAQNGPGPKCLRQGHCYPMRPRRLLLRPKVCATSPRNALGQCCPAASLGLCGSTGRSQLHRTLPPLPAHAPGIFRSVPSAVVPRVSEPGLIPARPAQVTEGSGKLLVVAVGENSEWGKTMALVGEAGDDETPLQVKLTWVASTVGKVGFVVAICCFVALLTK